MRRENAEKAAEKTNKSKNPFFLFILRIAHRLRHISMKGQIL
jgi:hypothetical protein